MASAWNVVRARNYDEVSGSENCRSPSCSPAPDKFKRKLSVNSLRMSFRKRIPLKRINVNGGSPDYYRREPWKQRAEDAKKKEFVARSAKVDKARGVAVETSVKKTFYKMTEQFTGTSKKRQLKETPRKSTPRTRYRERLRSPPDTPSSPAGIVGTNSPCFSTPIGQVKSLKKYTRRASNGIAKRPCHPENSQSNRRDSDDFTRHLELISCGIQQLESNSNKMLAAISHIGLDYEVSPLQKKVKRGRICKDEMRKYTPIRPQRGSFRTEKNDHSQPSTARGMLRRTMTRMSLRVKNRPCLRSTKSASNIEASCFNGPMTSRKLPPLQENSRSK